MKTRSVVVTEIDFDRLDQLTRSPRYRTSHAVLLSSLREELERRKVVPPTRVPKGTVTMNSRVRIRDLATSEIETYTLVYPEEASLDDGRLSVLAPLGMALLGRRVGETVEFNAPAGLRRLKIEEVLYQPEAAGDLHL